MDDPGEHALVVKAVCDCLGGCFEWDDKCAMTALGNPDNKGYLPRFIRREVAEYVRKTGGSVVIQVREERPNWRDNLAFYYKVILPLPEFKCGLFVEVRLTGVDDPDFPEVTIVSAHSQTR